MSKKSLSSSDSLAFGNSISFSSGKSKSSNGSRIKSDVASSGKVSSIFFSSKKSNLSFTQVGCVSSSKERISSSVSSKSSVNNESIEEDNSASCLSFSVGLLFCSEVSKSERRSSVLESAPIPKSEELLSLFKDGWSAKKSTGSFEKREKFSIFESLISFFKSERSFFMFSICV